MSSNLIKLAISVGEPAGIGPDQLIILSQNLTQLEMPNIVLAAFCDKNLIQTRADLLKLKIKLIEISIFDLKKMTSADPNSIYIIKDPSDTKNTIYSIHPQKPDPNNAPYIINKLKQATLNCLNNTCDALITCPINKSVINQSHIHFTGHTEYIADLCNGFYNRQEHFYTPVMMLMGKDFENLTLRTALITTHLPLNKIIENITKDSIINHIKIIHSELINKFKIQSPKILITGLNPHAGENGCLGSEEVNIIIPAINILRSEFNIKINGPYAADSIFHYETILNNDIIVAMYHDQGLTGFKARAFGNSANITLGLPIIRTSVDHGTALDLAGTGKINNNSLIYAIKTAVMLVNNKKINSYG